MYCHIHSSSADTPMPPFLAATESPAAWYVAYTEARQESLAVTNLQQQGFVTYLPLYKTYKKKSTKPLAGSGEAIALIAYEPMFPRYMFFKPSNDRQSISSVRSTRGVSSIVKFGANFALIQPATLAAIREHEEQRNQEDLQANSALKPGCHVRLTDPALDSLEGLVHSVSAQRIIVLMEILGRQTRVKLAQDQVELA